MPFIKQVSLFVTAFLCVLTEASTRIPLHDPQPSSFQDNTLFTRLPDNEIFTWKLPPDTIASKVIASSEGGVCFTKKPQIHSRTVMTTNLLSAEGAIRTMVVLPNNQRVFVADGNYLFSFSLDPHFLLKSLAPQTHLSTKKRQIGSTGTLIATQNEQYLFYITPDEYYVITSETLGADTQYFMIQSQFHLC